MVSAVSAEASAHGHLHLDPSLNVPVKIKCADCCPGSKFFMKLLCCGGCCNSNCCNRTERLESRVIYCTPEGRCVFYDPDKADSEEEALRKSAQRVANLVAKDSHLSVIRLQSGVDLQEKIEKAEPITVGEIKKIQRARTFS